MKFALVALLMLASVSTVQATHRLEDSSDSSLANQACEQLYFLRNEFFHRKGLCFTRPTAVHIWGNDGCKYQNSADMPMTKRETDAVANLVAVERQKGCPRY